MKSSVLILLPFSRFGKWIKSSLENYRRNNDHRGEARALSNIGQVYADLSETQKALDYFKQALSLIQTVDDKRLKVVILNNIGAAHNNLSEIAKALNYFMRSLQEIQSTQKSSRIADDNYLEAITLHNIAQVYSDLNIKARALEYFKQALSIFQSMGNRRSTATTLNTIGLIYFEWGDHKKALNHFTQALSLREDIDDYRGQAVTLNNIGLVYKALNEKTKSLDYFSRALRLQEDINNRHGQASTLGNIGFVNALLGEIGKALDHYRQALLLYQLVGNLEGQASVLNNIGFSTAQQNQPELAIAFYKKSVNTYEEIRTGNRQLTPEQQASYTETIRKTYESLAALLFQENRIAEALQVLDLLKVQDLQDFLKDRNPNPNEIPTLQLLDPETAIVQDFEQQKPQALNQWLTSPSLKSHIQTIQATAIAQGLKSAGYQNLQTRLNQLSPTAALFYPLILPDRLELVILTPGKDPIHTTVKNLPKDQLEQTIDRFSQQIGDAYPNGTPKNDLTQTKQTAQTLYKWLIEPIAPALKAANITTLLYAPDGKLRYIPLAALHDGQNWLIQSYTINSLTALALTPTAPAVTSSPKALVGAVTQGSVVQVAGQRHSFDPLTQTAREAQAIGSLFNTTPLIDQALSTQAIQTSLPSANIIHIASHAEFNPQSPDLSFILLGNNETLTLRQLKDLKLANISLFVLSACETARGVSKDGIELFGFGYQLQRNQVRAAIASLWTVNDGSTSQLMQSFYKNLQTGKISPVEALHRAQRETLGDHTWNLLPNQTTLRAEIAASTGQLASPAKADPSHPYYWAPFILIGNGL